MPVLINDIMQKFANDMKELFGNDYRETIVYGSYARGDYNENSDIDVMILVDMQDEIINRYNLRTFISYKRMNIIYITIRDGNDIIITVVHLKIMLSMLTDICCNNNLFDRPRF